MTSALLSERGRRDLEWPELLAAIAGYAVGDVGKQRILALGPLADQATAETRLSVLAEALRLYGEGASLPCRAVDDVTDGVERARRHGVLSAEELWQVLVVLETAQSLDRWGKSHGGNAPLLTSTLEVGNETSSLLRDLSRSLESGGRLRDDASSGLRTARREVQNLRRQVQSRIGELINRYRDALQDGYFAERDGRYVLPVRTDAPFRVEGIVLGTSASGSTLYVEPQELGALGHKLRMAEVEVEREEARILALLSEDVTPLSDEVLWAFETSVRADVIAACVRFAARTGSRIAPFGQPGCLRLRGARHPLLAHGEREVVPSDLMVESGMGLVLSGPNAGGKTVALKTLGLIALLQSSGLPVSVDEGSAIGFFSSVFSDIGDDQSLSQSLSTFSGHVERMRDVLDESEAGTLVLVDELMSGTDPNEGAVLAIALLEEFVAKGAAVVVTTHYEPLKVHAAGHPRLENAAVGFDFELMQPTFRVEQGRPGASSAIVVAVRHGLPRHVTNRAEGLLPEIEARNRKEQLDLEQIRAVMERERKELSAELEKQRVATHQLQSETEKLREKRRSDMADESDELRRAVREARAELKQIRTRFKSAALPAELRDADKRIDGLSNLVALGGEAERASRKGPAQPAAPLDLRPGMKVRVAGLTTPAEVLEAPARGQVRVVAGTLKLTLRLEDVALWTGGSPAVGKGLRTQPKAAPPPAPARQEVPLKAQDTTLDLRGKRVEAALAEVDTFLDELLQRQEVGGYVLHGHGTGAMKAAVREHLRGHPCVTSSRPAERDEGGDAFTVVWLSSIG